MTNETEETKKKWEVVRLFLYATTSSTSIRRF